MVSTDRTLQCVSDDSPSRFPLSGAACHATARHVSLPRTATGSGLPPTAQPPSATDSEPCLVDKADPLARPNIGISSHATQGRMASLVSRFRTAPPRPGRRRSPSPLTPPGAVEDQQVTDNESFKLHHLTAVGTAMSTAVDAISSSPCQTAAATCALSPVPSAQMAASSDGRLHPSHISVTVHTKSQLLTRPPRRSCRHASQRSESTGQCAAPPAVEQPIPAQPHARLPGSRQKDETRDSVEGCAARLGMSLMSESDAVNAADCETVLCDTPSMHRPTHDSVAQSHMSLLQQDPTRRNCNSAKHHLCGLEDGTDDDPVTQLLQRCHRVLDATHRPPQAVPATPMSAVEPSSTSEYAVLLSAARSPRVCTRLHFWMKHCHSHFCK